MLGIEFEGYTCAERTPTLSVAFDYDKAHGCVYRNYLSDPFALHRAPAHRRYLPLRAGRLPLVRVQRAGSSAHSENAAACPCRSPCASTRFHTIARAMRKRRPPSEMRTPE